MPHPAEEITADEQAEITRAVEAGEILSDDDLAEYVKASTIADLMGDADGDGLPANMVLAKRLLAAERARGDDARSTLVDKLSKVILASELAGDDPAMPATEGPADDATTEEAAKADAPTETTPDTGARTIKRQTDSAWWCPICDHSATLDIVKCANCGATRDGDTVTP